MTESSVTRSCLHYLGTLPRVKIWRNHTGLAVFRSGMTVSVGIPSQGGGGDFIGFEKRDGVAVFLSIEFKRKTGGTTSLRQSDWADFVRLAGGRAVILASLEDAQREFPQ